MTISTMKLFNTGACYRFQVSPELQQQSLYTLTQATLSHLAMPGLRLKMLDDRIFSGLPRLRWLDVRDNFLTTVPFNVIRHQW